MSKVNTGKVDLPAQNVSYEVKDNLLVIVVDLSKTVGPSKSGKTTLVATTKGSVELPSGARFSLNAFVK
jgi:ABC-type lipoprotein export system ATPase subunit